MLKKYARRIFYVIAGLMALFLAINGALYYYPNFYSVVPGVVYRSGQLTEHRYALYLRKYHIKTIINLRSAEPDAPWYETEMRVVKNAGVTYYEIPLTSLGRNSPENLAQLVKTIEEAPKPVLIHCWHGADRTGLASAMSVILLTNENLPTALNQISYKFGAIDPRTTGKIEFIAYETWLKQHHYQHSRQRFIEWIQQLPTDKNYAENS